MPSATIDKLNQLKAQLEQCNNETAALLLKRTIAKLESQLQIDQLTTKSAKTTSKEAPETSQTSNKHQSPTQNQAKEEPKATPKTTKTPQAKSKSRDHKPRQRRLLPGNGTHRAWCRIPGIIRRQKSEVEAERPEYFLEFDGYQLPLRVKKRFTKRISLSLGKPLMVKFYPQIIDGQIVFAQFCGMVESTPEISEDWVMIGVWNSGSQRVLVQRDQQLNQSRYILQHSPLVDKECLEKLKSGELYRFECQRDGLTVKIVDVEAIEHEAKKFDQVIS